MYKEKKMKYIIDKKGNIVNKNKNIEVKNLKNGSKVFIINKDAYVSEIFTLVELNKDYEKGRYLIIDGKAVENKNFLTKEQYEKKLQEKIKQEEIELINKRFK